MNKSRADHNVRPPVDAALARIADYILEYAPGASALEAAAWVLKDSIACALLALEHAACTRHLGPLVPGAEVASGARVLGTSYQLDPVKATFDNGALIRWLDFNDTWLAAEWGHPSDNAAAILSVADYVTRAGRRDCTVGDVLHYIVLAHEIQGVLALENSLNRVGLDHVAFVKLASAGCAAALLGANREQLLAALSHAVVDGQSLRTYRHAPNTGSRKSWAAGDAAARGVWLAFFAMRGEAVVPGALTAPTWGFYDVLFGGKPFSFGRDLGSYVVENVLFKVSFPAEFHAQTAVEAAIRLHPQVVGRLEAIERVEIETHESAIRIISKTGALHNPADRDHCLQYMVAVGLLFGELTADHYEDAAAADARIDALRAKMEVREEPRYSADYLDADKRSIANALRVVFADGTATERCEVEYPLGHRRRRDEARPRLQAKLDDAVRRCFDEARGAAIGAALGDAAGLVRMSVPRLMDLFVRD